MIRRSNTDALLPSPRPQIVPKRVSLLPAILEHVAVPVRVERNVVLHEHVVRAVYDHAALFALAYNVLADHAASNARGHVKVNGVTAEVALLPEVAYLDSLDVLGDAGCVKYDEMTWK